MTTQTINLNPSTGRASLDFSPRTLLPFLWTGLGWLAICLFFCARGLEPMRGLFWAAGIWLLCMADLLAMAQVVSQLLQLSGAGPQSTARGPRMMQIFFWGLIKLACLGLFGVILWAGRETPQRALLMGLGTLVVVPLVGGFWWSQRELSHARRA